MRLRAECMPPAICIDSPNFCVTENFLWNVILLEGYFLNLSLQLMFVQLFFFFFF